MEEENQLSRELIKEYTVLTEKINSLDETIFHNANGYIGVRGCLEEGVPGNWDTMRGTYINGFYDIIPMKQAEMLCNFVDKKETMINIADTMTITCIVDGEMLDMTRGKIIKHTRTLNMDEGVTVRKLIWESSQGKQIELVSKRMTSFEMLSLFTIEYSVKALNFDGDIKIISGHNPDVVNYSNPNDPRLAAESLKNLNVNDITLEGNTSIAMAETNVSGLKVCSLVNNEIALIENGEVVDEKSELIGKKAAYTCVCKIKKSGCITLNKVCIFTDSVRNRDQKQAALDLLDRYRENGLSHYYEYQKDYLKKYWHNSEMEIDGDEAMSKAVTFNMYELLQSCTKDRFCSIAAKGMSGEGYEGHYFWDTETFILPYFIMTNPELAKTIIRYRYSTLDKARRNASLLGHTSGALFPWRTITGVECSGYFVSGSAAYHINADIAYAVISYYLATDDIDFMAEAGAEILIETARLWLDLGNYQRDGKFVLNVVTGPDEYTCMVNNNYYTNCAAKFNLNWAVKMYRILERKGMAETLKKKLHVIDAELESMEKAAKAMLLLYDEELGINPQDDSFLSKPLWDIAATPKSDFPLLLHYHPLHLYRYQVCKQADTVLAYFMFESEQDADVMRRSFEYYEKITTHDSSLSTCVFSIVASRLGLTDKAYDYFGDSAKLDLENRHDNTKDGIHTANMGGCYMAIVNGFASLRIGENGLSIAPFVPKSWNGYRFNIVYRGRLLNIAATHEGVTVKLLEGEGLNLKVYGKDYDLMRDKAVCVAMA